MINMQLGLFSYYYHTFMLLLIRMQYGDTYQFATSSQRPYNPQEYASSRPPYLWEGLHTHHHIH